MTTAVGRPGLGSRRRFRPPLVVAMVLAVILVGCSGSDSRFEYMRIIVDGQETLGISKKDTVVRGVVIYFHGTDADEFSITADPPHQEMTETLVDAGFAVVASEASGNAFGNAQSTGNYRELANMALAHYRVQNVFFLAESMGAISAINLLGEVGSARVRGLAAINPVLNLSGPPGNYDAMIEQSYPDRTQIALANPMNLAPKALADKKIRVYSNAANADQIAAFNRLHGADADIELVHCDLDIRTCLRGGELVKWFTSLERRTDS